MARLKHVLAATDFSPFSTQAVERAAYALLTKLDEEAGIGDRD